jgi:hypothetical protein
LAHPARIQKQLFMNGGGRFEGIFQGGVFRINPSQTRCDAASLGDYVSQPFFHCYQTGTNAVISI